ncbi:MAG TPA: DUF58 domain-containing protein [Methanocella sp.]|nr:DUF58 domain-containing protein [Methanocella sp.]
MLSRRASSDAGTFLFLLLSGIALGNTIMIYLSLVPLFFVLFSLANNPQPDHIQVTRRTSAATTCTDEAVEISITLKMEGGRGIVTVADPLPEHFTLASGNNFHLYWNDGRNAPLHVTYKVRCTKRGVYDTGPTHIEHFYGSWMGRAQYEPIDTVSKLIVRPKPARLKKIRNPRRPTNLPMPAGATCKLGIKTTNFTEIRHYSYGDPFRTINWKATARLSTTAGVKPYVNEYEREGKKTIWIFVDSGTWMGLGSTVDNVFEYAVRAASGIASFYLGHDVAVGLYVYNKGELIFPDTGRKQAFQILRSLSELKISNEDNAKGNDDDCLKKAVRECSRYMSGTSPMFVIVTMVGKDNARDLVEGIRLMRKYSPNARVPRIIVLHISGYSLVAVGICENAGAAMLEMGNMPAVRAIRKAGALVIPWNPRMKSLGQTMMIGYKRRSS